MEKRTIFFTDKLDYFNESCYTRDNKYYPRPEVPSSAIILHNFTTSDGTKLTHYTNSKNWKLIHNAMMELKTKLLKKKNL